MRFLTALATAATLLLQSLTPALHASAAHARQMPGAGAFCGTGASPALLARFQRVAPPELLKGGAPKTAHKCPLCVLMHGGAGLAPATATFLPARLPVRVPRTVALTAFFSPSLRLQPARGPPRPL